MSLILHYQPQIDARNGNLIGTEALARWIHPEMGFIPPGKFIPIAEGSDLIHALGESVLRKACRQKQIWAQRGWNDFSISVNVSNRQLQSGKLSGQFKKILSENNLAGAGMNLEITESCMMDDMDRSLGILKDLKTLGFSISIDDFGTGYSSLAVLERFPIDTLKIDRCFVSDITTNQAHVSITNAIVQMADALGLKTVAEGVEMEEERELLRTLGCHVIQGFLFGKPVSPEEFEQRWLAA